MGRWRDFVEGILPWYSPALERVRDARTERRLKRSAAMRRRGERIIADYEQADAAASAQGQRMIDEIRRDDDAR